MTDKMLRLLMETYDSANGGGGGDITLETLNVSANGETNAPSGKAYNKVVAGVPNTYAAGDEGKVVSGGELVAQTSDTATQNGTVDTTLINSLTVAVASGTPFYSGTLTLASRPAATGVYATLDAPNCTHFVMYAADDPDTTTGNAFFGFGIVEKDSATLCLMSNNAGSGYGTSGSSIVWNFTSQIALKETVVTFNANNIELSATSVASTAHLPQAGLDYQWCAW